MRMKDVWRRIRVGQARFKGAAAVVLAFVFGLLAGPALAEPVVGAAHPWQMSLQPAYSPVMETIRSFHDMLFAIIVGIVVVVLAILAYIIFRFNAKRNPVPSTTSHNTLLEIVWTAVPVIILVIIAIPSMKALYFSNRAPTYDMTIKVVGHQWYWSYNYPDNGDFSYDSLPIPDEELKPGQPRLLAVDNPLVVPVGATVQVLVNSDDVIHNWAVPSLGLKKDATPGRTNETWLKVNQEGVYYGQCSELCGVNHYFMPIEVRAVSKEAFDAWVKEAKAKYASNEARAVKLATADAPAR